MLIDLTSKRCLKYVKLLYPVSEKYHFIDIKQRYIISVFLSLICTIWSLTGGGGGGKGEDTPDSSSTAGDFSTEYAKSGKSKCKGCEDFIGKVL